MYDRQMLVSPFAISIDSWFCSQTFRLSAASAAAARSVTGITHSGPRSCLSATVSSELV